LLIIVAAFQAAGLLPLGMLVILINELQRTLVTSRQHLA
jgi:hypothetical protein